MRESDIRIMMISAQAVEMIVQDAGNEQEMTEKGSYRLQGK
jgi:hypothetical protein